MRLSPVQACNLNPAGTFFHMAGPESLVPNMSQPRLRAGILSTDQITLHADMSLSYENGTNKAGRVCNNAEIYRDKG